MVKQIGMGKDYRNIPCGVSGTAGSTKDAVFRYFTIGELTKSVTAERFGIDNTPTAAQIDSLSMLITEVLDPLREAFGKVKARVVPLSVNVTGNVVVVSAGITSVICTVR